jgi:hypothetical protein
MLRTGQTCDQFKANSLQSHKKRINSLAVREKGVEEPVQPVGIADPTLPYPTYPTPSDGLEHAHHTCTSAVDTSVCVFQTATTAVSA